MATTTNENQVMTFSGIIKIAGTLVVLSVAVGKLELQLARPPIAGTFMALIAILVGVFSALAAFLVWCDVSAFYDKVTSQLEVKIGRQALALAAIATGAMITCVAFCIGY